MIQLSRIWVYIVCVASLMSCQEEELPAEFIGEPVFYVSANLDGNGFSKAAGEDGFFMSTSYSFDANYNHLNGTFEQIYCDDCHESLSFTISTTPTMPDPNIFNAFPTLGNYDYSSSIGTTTGNVSLVEIAYTTPDNIIFCSNLGAQPQQAVFEITAVEDFDNNDQGQPTKKLYIRFIADLYDDSGNMMHIDGTGIIAVAHP